MDFHQNFRADSSKALNNLGRSFLLTNNRKQSCLLVYNYYFYTKLLNLYN